MGSGTQVVTCLGFVLGPLKTAAAVDTGVMPLPAGGLHLHGDFLHSLEPSLKFPLPQAAAPAPLQLPPETRAHPQVLLWLCLLSRPRVGSFSAWAPAQLVPAVTPGARPQAEPAVHAAPRPPPPWPLLVSESEPGAPGARPPAMLLPSLACPALATSPPSLEQPPGLLARPVPHFSPDPACRPFLPSGPCGGGVFSQGRLSRPRRLPSGSSGTLCGCLSSAVTRAPRALRLPSVWL